MSRKPLVVFSFGLMVLVTSVTSGQDYPNKPIRVLASAPGGGVDIVARLIAQGISPALGQPVIVDNRPSVLLAEIGSKAPPDGYTLTVQGGGHWIGPLLRKVSYDVVRDFSPISLISKEVFIVAVHPSLPAKSIKELIALAKARPGELNYSFGSVGASTHLAAELFKSMTGVNIVNVSYKGSAPAVTALVSGEVQLTFMDVGLVAPYVKSGRLRALAVTSAQPSALAPGLPTVAASDLPGYEAMSMTAIFAPAKTPAAVINRLHQEIVRVLKQPEVKEKFFNAGGEVVGSTPEELAAIIKSDMARMGKVIKDAGIKVE